MNLEKVRQSAHALEIEEVFGFLEADKNGLSWAEAERRLEKFGPNEIPERNGYRVLNILLKQFKSPLIYILIIAGAISLLLRDFVNAGVIFGAVVLNAAIGFSQELKVSNVLEELKKIVSYETQAIRDGHRRNIDSKNLVVGDVIRIVQGQRIPADARLISVNEFETNESVFTGESTPVDKKTGVLSFDTPVADRSNMVFSGTYAEQGNALAVIVATGQDTELGKIAELIKKGRVEDITPLEVKLGNLAKTLGLVFLFMSAALFAVGVLTGVDILTMFITAVAVAVSAIPEGLPVALGVILAIGAKRILDKGGLVRKMVAAEALGSTTVIASDKTATLTEGKMTLTYLVDAETKEFKFSEASKDIVECLALHSDAYIENPEEPKEEWRTRGRPMDKAIVIAVQELGINKNELDKQYPRISEIPFSAKYKYSATLVDFESKKQIFILGAPEVVLEKSALNDEALKNVKNKLEELASKGLRILGFASKEAGETKKDLEHEDLENMKFLAFAVFSDPIRKDVKESIDTAKEAGLRTVMVTGDHLLTARYVAKELGILKSDDRIIEGKQLGDAETLVDTIDRYDVFARVSPDEKVKIIRAYKEQNERVAVIGDGINDGPALLMADIGVAVGSGTDVAKEASDLVLLNDSFSIIVEAIRQGRMILDNIKKVIVFLLSDAFTEIILIAGSIFAGLPLALLPAQILWVNLIEDGLPAIALAFERDEEKEIMKRRPERNAEILGRDMKALIIMFTVVTDLVLFALYYFILRASQNIDYARTLVFIGLGLESMFYVYSVRSLSKPFWKLHIFSNHFLNFAVLAGFALYFAAIYIKPLQSILGTVTLGIYEWLALFAFALFNVAIIEMGKKIFMKR